MSETSTITPVIDTGDLYAGSKKEFEATPPGKYRMALSNNLRVKRTKSGLAQLEVFLTHVEPEARARFKGVNYRVLLEGTDKNGRSNAKQFGDMLLALGVSKEDIASGKPSVNLLGNIDAIPADEQWKGVPAAITINGDVVDLTGREATVVIEASEYNGKISYRANGMYAAN